MRTIPDAIDMQVGIGLGLEMPTAELATRIGRDESTIFRRKAIKADFIEQVRSFTAACASSTTERRIKEIESKSDIKGRLSAKAYKRLESILEREQDDGLTLAALKEALDRTEGKALDRKAILSRHEETVTHQISDESLSRLTAFMGKHQALLPAGEPKVIDVEPEPAN